MRNLPSFHAHKLAFGPAVVEAISKGMQPLSLDEPIGSMLPRLAEALEKRVQELVIVTMNRPRHQEFINAIRQSGAALRLITGGDIAAAVAPSLPDSGVDLYVGIGGSPEGVLTAAALRALGGEMQLRMAPRDEAARQDILAGGGTEISRVFTSQDLVKSTSVLFCATGISDSSLVPGVKLVGHKAITHTILMRARSRTVRYIRAVHDLKQKTIHLRSVSRGQGL
jgi:fructose-1,6-bisphosphatase II